MRKVAVSLIAVVAVVVPAVHAAPTEVLVKDDFFKPKRVTIQKDSRVTWRWKGGDMHNVALVKPGAKKAFTRSPLQTNGKYTYKFGKTGTWRILCEVHNGMTMKVIVKSS
jgi:plastocyanin